MKFVYLSIICTSLTFSAHAEELSLLTTFYLSNSYTQSSSLDKVIAGSNSKNIVNFSFSKRNKLREFSFNGESWFIDKNSSAFNFYLINNNTQYTVNSISYFSPLMAYANSTVYDAKVVGNYLVFLKNYELACFNLNSKKLCKMPIYLEDSNNVSYHSLQNRPMYLYSQDKSELYLCNHMSFDKNKSTISAEDCKSISLSQFD